MLIEVTKCKNCEREWITPLYAKPKDGLCHPCHESQESAIREPLASFFDKRDREEILRCYRGLEELEIQKCEV